MQHVSLTKKKANRALVCEILETHLRSRLPRNKKLTFTEYENENFVRCQYMEYDLLIHHNWTINIRKDGKYLDFSYQLELMEYYLEKGIWFDPVIERLKTMYPTIYYLVKDEE
jgi:hypothetical protein